ncbi:hypothetical protein AYL99_01171 [Fonsecaea erecta]|uniref:Uncharacterized protein n=1 Tax=Fonsecaea erecta TaxID=1367422 RepID=A0A178ZZF6_9EURO|nr:hypothetical protein AYL99_01171 [Fonsecaea erecta]OAP65199.1 hypothetical protein AYL99_01171 [Fonsecaea erecta]
MVSLNTVASARTSMTPALFSVLFQRCHTCLGVADSGRPEFDLDERNYQVFHGLAISIPQLQTSTKCAVCCLLLRAVQEALSQAPHFLLPDTYVIVRERLALGHISLGAIDRERLSDHDRTVAPPPCLQCYYLDTACGDCLDRDMQIPWLHMGDFEISVQSEVLEGGNMHKQMLTALSRQLPIVAQDAFTEEAISPPDGLRPPVFYLDRVLDTRVPSPSSGVLGSYTGHDIARPPYRHWTNSRIPCSDHTFR